MKTALVLLALSALTLCAHGLEASQDAVTDADRAIAFRLPLSVLLGPHDQTVAPLGVQYRAISPEPVPHYSTPIPGARLVQQTCTTTCYAGGGYGD